jgi:hypothetical protein
MSGAFGEDSDRFFDAVILWGFYGALRIPAYISQGC